MKILYSCMSQSWGGMEMFTIRSVLELLKRNIDVELICYPQSQIHIEAEKKSIITHTIKIAGYLNPFAVLKLIRLLRKQRFDLVHTQASRDLWLLVPALVISGRKIPLILSKQVGSFIKKKDVFHRFLYSRLTYALAISEVIKINLLDTCPLTEDKILLLHNSVDTDKFDINKYDPQSVRKELNIIDDELVIGMVARFSWGKGHEEFLYAAGELSKKYTNLKFLIVGEASRGETEYEEKIKRLAGEYNLKGKVIFAGYRSDIPAIISAMDIFAFPSHSEAFGIALVEAMSMSKPSVCSNTDGVLDIAVDGQTSYLFEKQNGSDLADKLEQFIKSPEKRKQFGMAARKRAVDFFDVKYLTDKVIEIYEMALKTGGAK